MILKDVRLWYQQILTNLSSILQGHESVWQFLLRRSLDIANSLQGFPDTLVIFKHEDKVS